MSRAARNYIDWILLIFMDQIEKYDWIVFLYGKTNAYYKKYLKEGLSELNFQKFSILDIFLVFLTNILWNL